MRSFKLPPAGFEQQPAPPPERNKASLPSSGGRVDPAPWMEFRPARSVRFRFRLLPGLLRLLLRAVAVRTAASGRLVDEQEERQLRLLRRCSPASGAGR